jgi:phosphoenolpyruvate-protein kinase (PTS system EI component)
MAATAGLRAARLAFDRQWLFLPAMRAVHRAETAGDASLPPPLT